MDEAEGVVSNWFRAKSKVFREKFRERFGG